jgi:hypothetical protein
MITQFGQLKNHYIKMMGLESGSKGFEEMETLHYKELLKHRVQPRTPSYVWPEWDEQDGIIERGEAGRMKQLVEVEQFNVLDIPFLYQDEPGKCKAYFAAIADWLRELGYLELAYVFLKDEPNNAVEYELVRNQGALIKSADPEIRRMCTEQPEPSKPEWGVLYDAVDIWCPLWFLYDEPSARERMEKGEQMWSATALCQGPVGTPWWQIDTEPLSYRSPFWLSWLNDINGFLYWSSTYWGAYETLQGVWEAPHFRGKFWGEGLLLYPGPPAGIKGFVPSIRLKLIREALEDYEYMVLGASLSKESEVDSIIGEVVTSFQEWSHGKEDYGLARERLAELILNSRDM